MVVVIDDVDENVELLLSALTLPIVSAQPSVQRRHGDDLSDSDEEP